MLFVLEILLTIAAWRKGWGAKALLPLAIGMGGAMLLGAMIGASGGPRAVEQAFPLFILFDLAIVGVLVWLVRRGPEGDREASLSVAPRTLPSGENIASVEPVNKIKVS